MVKKHFYCLVVLVFCSVMVKAQYAQLQGQWHLQSVTRSAGAIVYYDWKASKALNASPVYWGFNNGAAVILNDTTLTPGKAPVDTVEASHYSINADTLTLKNYFTKGEAETATNAPVVSYRIDKISDTELILILYDTGYYNAIRPIDVYSKKYVFIKK